MKQEALEALVQSIQQWRRYATGEDEFCLDDHACALCEYAYWAREKDAERGRSCAYCPAVGVLGPMCSYSVFDDVRHISSFASPWDEEEAFRVCAHRMVWQLCQALPEEDDDCDSC